MYLGDSTMRGSYKSLLCINNILDSIITPRVILHYVSLNHNTLTLFNQKKKEKKKVWDFKINSGEISECHGLLILKLDYPEETVFENGPYDHEPSSIWCHIDIT